LAVPGLIEGIAFEVEVLMDSTGGLNVTGAVLHPVVRCQSRLGRIPNSSLLHADLVTHIIHEQVSERE